MMLKALCLFSVFCNRALRRLPTQTSGQWSALLIIGSAAGWALSVPEIRAQQPTASSYSQQQLMSIATQMKDEAERSGNLSNNALERHLDAATVLAVRTKNGRAEFHAGSADEFFVVHGQATLLTGGTIINPQGTEEVRGDSVQGGTRTILKEGDVVHIPSKTPHQLLLDDGIFIYILVKIPSP
ncbi:MAG TPA: hypothetical protein VFB43_19565 [Terracidiphilus sp.]|nr:hypothetical protein [Terracidiphilus sp.]